MRRIARQQNTPPHELTGGRGLDDVTVERKKFDRRRFCFRRTNHRADVRRHFFRRPASGRVLHGIEDDLTAPVLMAIQRAKDPFAAFFHDPKQGRLAAVRPTAQVGGEMRVDERVHSRELVARNSGALSRVAACAVASHQPFGANTIFAVRRAQFYVDTGVVRFKADQFGAEPKRRLFLREDVLPEQRIRLVLG